MKISCMVVPDGVTLSADRQSARLRLSLVLTPSFEAGGIELAQWPEHLSTRSFRVALHGQDQAQVGPTFNVSDPDFAVAPEKAGARWRKVLPASEYAALREALTPPERVSPKEVKLAGEVLAADRTVTDAASDVADIVDDVVGGEVALSLALGYLRANTATSDALLGSMRRASTPAEVASLDGIVQHVLKEPFSSERRLQAWLGKHGRRLGQGKDFKTSAGGAPTGFAQEMEASNRRLTDDAVAEFQAGFGGSTITAPTPLQRYRPGAPAPAGAVGSSIWIDELHRLLDLKGPDASRNPEDSALDAFDVSSAPDGMVAPDEEEGPPSVEPTKAELVARKLAGLDAYPTARKFLRLIADVEITLSRGAAGSLKTVGQRTYGFVSAAASESAAAVRLSAFVLDWANGTFEPCPMVEWQDPAWAHDTAGGLVAQAFPLRDGLMKLRSGRFRLEGLDIGAARRAFKSAANATSEAFAKGASSRSIETSLPDIRSRGLALLDTAGQQAEAVGIVRSAHMLAQPDAPLFAEDMVSGYRVDIIHDRPGAAPAFSITDRDVIHQEIFEAFGKPLPPGRSSTAPWHPYEAFRERDAGFVGNFIRFEEKPTAGGSQPVQFVKEELFAWNGDALGLPAQDDRRPQAAPIDADDLQFSARFQLPAPLAGMDRRLSAFRVGRPVRVMVRVRKPNGGSVPLSAVRHLWDRCALGSGEGPPERDAPFILTRSERTQAPEVLIRRGDLQQQGGSYIPKPETLQPGDDADTLVLKAGLGPSRPLVSRVLLAPRSDFTAAEQAGAFDAADHDDHPSLKGVYRRVDLDQGGLRPVKDPRGGRDLGFAFVTQAVWPGRRLEPWYVDRGAQYLGLSLRRHGSAVADGRVGELDAAFWDGTPTDEAVKPVLLDVRSRGGDEPILSVDRRDLSDGPGVFTNAARVTIRLAPAEELKLDLWTFPGLDEALNTRRYFRKTIRPLLEMAGRIGSGLGLQGQGSVLQNAPNVLDAMDAGVISQAAGSPGPADAQLETAKNAFRTEWRSIASRQPIAGLTSVRTLTLVHAVARPLQAPRFLNKLNAPPLPLARLQAKTPEAWAAYLAAATRPGDAGHFLFVAGKVGFDRRSTGEVRCEIAWADHAPSATAKSSDGPPTSMRYEPIEPDGPWRYRPSTLINPLFSPIDNIVRLDETPGEAADLLDLVRNDAGALRCLTGPIVDGKAHLVALRLIGVSRFVEYFPPIQYASAMDDDAKAEAFEARHCAVTASRAALRSAVEQPWISQPGVEPFWIKATERPKPLTQVTASYTLPVTTPSSGNPNVKLAVYRPRIRLNLGPEWFTSGDGELLAVICRPADLVDGRSIEPDPSRPGRLRIWPREQTQGEALRRAALKTLPTDALDQPTWLSGLVTRWGATPTTRSEMLEPFFMPPEALGHFVAKVSKVKLPKKVEPMEVGVVTEDVAIFAYEPRWDSDNGGWFVEIEPETFATHDPTFQFAVARYQPHAIEGLELSEALAVDPIQAASAWRVRIERTSESLIAEVKGDSFTARAPALLDLPAGATPIDAAQLNATQRPNLLFEVGLPGGADTSAVQDINAYGSPVMQVVTAPSIEADGPTWRYVFSLNGLSGPREITISERIKDVDHEVAIGARRGDPFVVRPQPFAITLEV